MWWHHLNTWPYSQGTDRQTHRQCDAVQNSTHPWVAEVDAVNITCAGQSIVGVGVMTRTSCLARRPPTSLYHSTTTRPDREGRRGDAEERWTLRFSMDWEADRPSDPRGARWNVVGHLLSISSSLQRSLSILIVVFIIAAKWLCSIFAVWKMVMPFVSRQANVIWLLGPYHHCVKYRTKFAHAWLEQ